MIPWSRNADPHERELERLAHQGDQRALDALVRNKLRTGRAGELTLSELQRVSPGVIPRGVVGQFIQRLDLEPFQHFTLTTWLSDPYAEDFRRARLEPVTVKAGSLATGQDHESVEVVSRGNSLSVEGHPHRTDVWLWGAMVGEADADHVLVTWPEPQ